LHCPLLLLGFSVAGHFPSNQPEIKISPIVKRKVCASIKYRLNCSGSKHTRHSAEFLKILFLPLRKRRISIIKMPVSDVYKN
jgi:hypothetical protein